MNYRQGLFRIWLVFTILWGGYWGYEFIDASYRLYKNKNEIEVIAVKIKSAIEKQGNLVKNIRANKDNGEVLIDFYPELINELEQEQKIKNLIKEYQTTEIKEALIFIFSLPLMLLISYFVFAWIRKGFKPGD